MEWPEVPQDARRLKRSERAEVKTALLAVFSARDSNL
jgi:hypothetical protein